MATYKLSPLSLFLILLVTLVVSMLFGNWWKSLSKTSEGMVSFSKGVKPLTNVHITSYSGPVESKYGKHVSLLWDNIYFDGDAGNLIEVDGKAFTGNGNVDTTGVSIQNLYVISQNSGLNDLAINTFTPTLDENGEIIPTLTNEAKTTIYPSYREYVYTTQSKNTDTYCVFVLPWHDYTYIHVIDKTNATNVITAYLGPNHTSSQVTYNNDSLKFQNPPPKNTTKSRIYYDQTTGYVFTLDNQNIIQKIFSPTGEMVNKVIAATPLNSSAFNSWTGYDDISNTMILYIQNMKNVMIALIRPDSSGNYKLIGVMRFNSKGLDTGDGTRYASTFRFNNPPSSPNPDTSSSKPDNSDLKPANANDNSVSPAGNNIPAGNTLSTDKMPTDMLSDYYRWFYYWTTQGLDKNPSSPNFNYSDDYMLKTQIVPPVCPSCPSCPSIGTCTHCGGQGGSGTQSVDGNTLVQGANTIYSGVKGVIMGTEENIGSAGKAVLDSAKEAGSGAVNLAKDTAGGAVDLAKDTASGAVGLAKDTASGVVGLGKDIVGGTVGLGKDIVGGTVGLGREIVGGIASLGQGPAQLNGPDRTGYYNSYGGAAAGGANVGGANVGGANVGGANAGGQGGPGQLLPQNKSSVTDPYSYYGAMPSKGSSNFMPVASDFSKFGR
jgi:hypothetical protein